jgi:hypothetical protein
LKSWTTFCPFLGENIGDCLENLCYGIFSLIAVFKKTAIVWRKYFQNKYIGPSSQEQLSFNVFGN